MQEKHLFEYAVIRIVPRVEREEFLNVGVVVYCHAERFLKAAISLDEQRLRAFYKDIDIEDIQCYLNAFVQVCKGGEEAGTIGKLPVASRFRWLTATRSTTVQTSKVHPGFCHSAEETLQRLYEQLVE